MDKCNVTPDLIRRYIAGDTNLEETAFILKASKEDKYLQRFLDQAFELYEDSCTDTSDDNEIVENHFVRIPLALVAESDSDNLCSLKCELYLLSKFNKDEGITENSLLSEARKLNILKDEGTPLYNMGRLLSRHGLSVIKQYNACVNDIMVALNEQGCGVMAPIMGVKTFHAIVVLKVEEDYIWYYNPATDADETMSIEKFEKQWKKSCSYLVKTALKEDVCKPNSNIYHPRIEVPELTGKFKEIEWAFAELFHDIWSTGRLKEGWIYGQKRDDDKKIHPDLRPLADLQVDETNYDVRNARGAVYMLTQVFGYDLVNKDNVEQYCIEKLEELGYKVHKCDKQ